MITMHALNILLACFVLVFFSSSQGFETREVSLLLNSDGSLTYPAITPNCGKDRKINLIDYSYRHVRCHFADDCYTDYEEQLSAEAELLLHDMCSWKEKCNDLRFPLRSAEQINRINAAALKYSCVGQRNTFNICKGVEMYINNTIYLTSYDDARLYTECFCFINKGEFSMTINDLRLWRKNEGLCSPAGLLINSEPYACDEKKEGLDSIFHKNVTYTSVNAFVSLKLNSRTVVPDMVMLKISPKEKSRIYCKSKPSSSVLVTEKDPWPISRHVGSVIHTSAATSLQKTSQDLTDHNTGKQHKSWSDSSSSTIPILVFVCIVLCLLIIIFVCILCFKPELFSRLTCFARFRKLIRQGHQNDDQNERRGRELSTEGPQMQNGTQEDIQQPNNQQSPQTIPKEGQHEDYTLETRNGQGLYSEESPELLQDRSQHIIKQPAGSWGSSSSLENTFTLANKQQLKSIPGVAAPVQQLNPNKTREHSSVSLNDILLKRNTKHELHQSNGELEQVRLQLEQASNPQLSEQGVKPVEVCNTPSSSCGDFINVSEKDITEKTPFNVSEKDTIEKIHFSLSEKDTTEKTPFIP